MNKLKEHKQLSRQRKEFTREEFVKALGIEGNGKIHHVHVNTYSSVDCVDIVVEFEEADRLKEIECAKAIEVQDTDPTEAEAGLKNPAL